METIRTYAKRFARLCYLEQVCPDGHPVVLTERQLVDMARSKFQEAMFSRYEEDEVQDIRPLLVDQIRSIAKDGLAEQIPDVNTRMLVSSAIDGTSFDHLFATVH